MAGWGVPEKEKVIPVRGGGFHQLISSLPWGFKKVGIGREGKQRVVQWRSCGWKKKNYLEDGNVGHEQVARKSGALL